MLTKAITYTDFEGNERTETFHFHISKSELVEKNLENLDENIYLNKLQEVTRTSDMKKIYENFKWIILGSYGVRSEDGRFFRKTEQQTRDFEQSAAYEALYDEMFTNAVVASEFINTVFPKDIDAFADRITANAARVKAQAPGNAQETLQSLGVDPQVAAQFPTAPVPAAPVPAAPFPAPQS